MEITRSKEDNPSFWKNSYYHEIGYSIYKDIWHEKSNKNITSGQQHARTVNEMGSKERVYQSLKLMDASYIECKNLKVEETCVLFHFKKNNCNFCCKYIGFLHAGDLLAQHLVVIGDSVCLYNLKFAIFGEVG